MSATALSELGGFICLFAWLLVAVRRPALGCTAAPLAAGLMVALSVVLLREGWPRSAAFALWMSASAVTVAFSLLAPMIRSLRPLGAWVAGYGTLATALSLFLSLLQPAAAAPAAVIMLDVTAYLIHVAPGVITYALVSLAALNALATLWHARKLKRRSSAAEAVPSLTDAQRLTSRLLFAAAFILAAGIASGFALSLVAGLGFHLDHKALFSLLALLAIIAIVALDRYAGLGGRRAARLVLAVFLLLTLAYPGVKIVFDMVLTPSVP